MYNIVASGPEVKARWFETLTSLKGHSQMTPVVAKLPMTAAEPIYKSPCKAYVWNDSVSTKWVALGQCRLDICARGDSNIISIYAVPLTGRSLYWSNISKSFNISITPNPDAGALQQSQWYQITTHMFAGEMSLAEGQKATLVSVKMKDRNKVKELQRCIGNLLTVRQFDDSLAEEEIQKDLVQDENIQKQEPVEEEIPVELVFSETEVDDIKAKYAVAEPLFSDATEFESTICADEVFHANNNLSQEHGKKIVSEDTVIADPTEAYDSDVTATPEDQVDSIDVGDIEIDFDSDVTEQPLKGMTLLPLESFMNNRSSVDSDVTARPPLQVQTLDLELMGVVSADEDDQESAPSLLEQSPQHEPRDGHVELTDHDFEETAPILHTRHSSLSSPMSALIVPKFTVDDKKELVNWLDEIFNSVCTTLEPPTTYTKVHQPVSLIDERVDRAQKELDRMREWVQNFCTPNRTDQVNVGMRILRKLEHELSAIQRFRSEDAANAAVESS